MLQSLAEKLTSWVRGNPEERRLGSPLRDAKAIERRMNHFALMTEGKGFRVPKTAKKSRHTRRSRPSYYGGK